MHVAITFTTISRKSKSSETSSLHITLAVSAKVTAGTSKWKDAVKVTAGIRFRHTCKTMNRTATDQSATQTQPEGRVVIINAPRGKHSRGTIVVHLPSPTCMEDDAFRANQAASSKAVEAVLGMEFR